MLFPTRSPHVRVGYERYRQLRRILTTSEILRQFRYGCRLEFLNRETSVRTEDNWHVRTTRRDLEFLESMGLVESQPALDGIGVTWHWIESAPTLSRLAPEKVAEPEFMAE